MFASNHCFCRRILNYSLKASFTFLAIFWLIFFTKKTSPPNLGQDKTKVSWRSMPLETIKLAFDMFKTIFKKRPRGLHWLIMTQIYMFATYWFVLEEKGLKYLYMLKTFEGFTGTDFATFMVFLNVISVIGLVLVMPLMSRKLRMHDALMLTLILWTESTGLLWSAFVNKLGWYYAAHGFMFLGFCKYSIVRSLLSKAIDKDEIGKAFSALAIVSGLMPIISNPVFRSLYNSTLETFPSAFIILASAVLATSTVLNFVNYTQKHRMRNDNSDLAEQPRIFTASTKVITI